MANKLQQGDDSIAENFRGELEYRTTCHQCGSVSSHPSNYENLTLNTISQTSIESCLSAMCASEDMTGPNQYQCSGCNTKVDAHRQLVITKLPRYLSLHLVRFEFDLATLSKRKLGHPITFTESLKMNIDGERKYCHQPLLSAN